MYAALKNNENAVLDYDQAPLFVTESLKAINLSPPISNDTGIPNPILKGMITRDNMHAFSLDGIGYLAQGGLQQLKQVYDQKQHVDFDDIMNASSRAEQFGPSDIISGNLRRTKLRGQTPFQGSTVKWEKWGTGFFNAVPFAVTITKTENVPGEKRRAATIHKMGTFVMCYSSFEPSFSQNPKQGLLPFEPVWKDYRFMDKQDGRTFENTIKVDMNMVGDASAWASIVAALANTHPEPNSYIYCVPYFFHKDEFTTAGLFPTPRHCAIHGASGGSSLMMCILGSHGYYAAGFIKNIVHGGEFLPGYDSKVMYSGTQGTGVTPSNIFPSYGDDNVTSQFTTTTGQTVPGVVKTIFQLNFVESVDMIVPKIAYVLGRGGSYIIPAMSSTNTNMASFINSNESRKYMYQWLNMAPYIYTLAEAQDGKSIIVDNSSANNTQLQLHSLCMGATIDDYTTLQSLLLYGELYIGNKSYNLFTDDQQFQKAISSFITAKGDRQSEVLAKLKKEGEQRALLRKQLDPVDFEKRMVANRLEREKTQRNLQAARQRAGVARRAARQKAKSNKQSTKDRLKMEIAEMKKDKEYKTATPAQKKELRKLWASQAKQLKGLSPKIQRAAIEMLQPKMFEALGKFKRRGTNKGLITAFANRHQRFVDLATREGMSRERALQLAPELGLYDRNYWEQRFKKQTQDGTAAPSNVQVPYPPAPILDGNNNNQNDDDDFDEAGFDEWLNQDNEEETQTRAPSPSGIGYKDREALNEVLKEKLPVPKSRAKEKASTKKGAGKTKASGAGGMFKKIGSDIGNVFDDIF